MIQDPHTGNRRLDVVDALRGIALLAIVLLHNLEHYNLITWPEGGPAWFGKLNKDVWDATFFLLAGKAYATFSLLFGFSFYIQLRNARQRGDTFKARFAWRMLLLIVFSQLHALFYNGDILLLYAVVGFLLILVCDWKDRTVFVLAIILLLQPVEWGRFIYGLFNPEAVTYGHYYLKFAHLAAPVMKDGSFLEVLQSNITHGQLYSNLWQVEHGRLFQTSALFLFGMLLGRRDFFVKSEASIRNWKKILKYGAIAFAVLFLFNRYALPLVEAPALKAPLQIIFPRLFDFAFMGILVSVFTLCWFRSGGTKFQKIFVPYGRMSLTNYITQSIIGVCIYYGFGLSLYLYAGATFSLLIGFGIFGLQLIFSRWWLERHKQGPLEYLWRKGTWLGKR